MGGKKVVVEEDLSDPASSEENPSEEESYK